jgi:hypothetical protein
MEGSKMINNMNETPTQFKSRAHIIKTFRDRDNWIKLLLAANGESLGAKVVGARIAHHHNVETGQCNPKIETLVLGTGISESTVRRRIDELEVAGWLRVNRTLGRHSNSYEVRVPTLSGVTGLNPVSYESVDRSNPVNGDRVQDDPTLLDVTPQPCQNQSNPVTADTQKSESKKSEEKSEELGSPQPDLAEDDSERRSRSHHSETDLNFEEFYQHYPRHAAKAAALKAYRTVIIKKLATHDVLLVGAMRYAAERSNQDPKYTKHPGTWLVGGCWDDEPAQPIGATYSNSTFPPGGRSDHIAVAEQLARQSMKKKEGGHVQ